MSNSIHTRKYMSVLSVIHKYSLIHHKHLCMSVVLFMLGSMQTAIDKYIYTHTHHSSSNRINYVTGFAENSLGPRPKPTPARIAFILQTIDDIVRTWIWNGIVYGDIFGRTLPYHCNDPRAFCWFCCFREIGWVWECNLRSAGKWRIVYRTGHVSRW